MRGFIVVIVILALSAGLYLLLLAPEAPASAVLEEIVQAEAQLLGALSGSSENSKTPLVDFEEARATYWVGSSPVNNAASPQVPERVVVRFMVPLTPPSVIQVTHDGKSATAGAPEYYGDRLSLSVPLAQDQGAGAYAVTYIACSSEQECSAGRFGFNVRLP